MKEYWNHNTAFHDELVAETKMRGGSVLDIGCGDGLLLQRLARVCQRF
ncbi:SAM-dependent methyltransferase, partial [Xylanibacillus composti]|nr:SAM-dependent methyltransferase [Xylanibacillus composti]